MKQRRGQVLIGAIFVIIIVALLGIIAVSLLSTESFSAAKNLQGIQALNVAEGGIRFTVATSLAADANWSNNTDFGPVSLSPGTFRVRYLLKATKNCWLEVTGTVSGVSRVVRARVRKGGQLYQFTDFAAYAGNPGSVGGELKFQNASKILGSFYYYGPINILNSTLPCQTGGIIMSSSINPPAEAGIPAYYESWEQIGTAEPLPWNNTYYANWLNVANQSGTSNYTIDNTNENLSGGTVWYKNLTMKNNASITGPGTVCATGVINTSNTSHFVGQVRIIALGSPNSINFNDNTYWTATAEVIALDQLNIDNYVTTPANSILYSSGEGSSGIYLQRFPIIRGSVLAPYGTVTSKNNGWIQGLVYANSYQAYSNSTLEGGAVFYSVGYFHNDSMAIQNPDMLPPILPPGISIEATAASSFEIYGWREAY